MLQCLRPFSRTHSRPHVRSISSILMAIRVLIRRPKVPRSIVIMRFLRPMGESERSVMWTSRR